MEASRRSVNAHYSFGSIGSSLSTDFQVCISKCWDPYVSPSCTIFFFCSSFPLFQHVDFVTIYQRDGFRVCLFQPWFLCTQTKAIGYNFSEQNLISWFFAFFLLSVLVKRINKFGWLPCKRQEMLTQGLASNPTGKLSISSVTTPPHLLDCLISTMNSVSILFLL